jgi:hypothetical protein
MAVVLMILGFIWWWPLGLVALGFLFARRRYWRRAAYAGDGQMMGCGQGTDRWERKVARAQDRVDRVRQRMESRFGPSAGWFGGGREAATSGNHAFDEYRTETLRRLEEEQTEFKSFLTRLRDAKDRAEFDQFMSARRPRPAEPNEPPQG